MGFAKFRTREPELDVQIGFSPFVTRRQQREVGVDDALLQFGESEGDLLASDLQVQRVNAPQHAEGEHVFSAFGIGDVFQALALQGYFVDCEAVRRQLVMGLLVGRSDCRVLIGPPFVLQQDDATGLEFIVPDPAQQHLLIEGHYQIGLVATVSDTAGCQANAIAAGAGDAARRRLNFGGNDLDGPDAVSHARRDRREGLAATLSALAGIAHDLDNVLVQSHRQLALGGGPATLLPVGCGCGFRPPGRAPAHVIGRPIFFQGLLTHFGVILVVQATRMRKKFFSWTSIPNSLSLLPSGSGR